MRHGMVNRKLGRTSAHRNALFRNQLSSLIDRERIITTLPKAKELRPQVERLVTIGKTDNVHNRRQVFRVVGDETLVAKVFDTLGPRFAERPGGYTRIITISPRRSAPASPEVSGALPRAPYIRNRRTTVTLSPSCTGTATDASRARASAAPAGGSPYDVSMITASIASSLLSAISTVASDAPRTVAW